MSQIPAKKPFGINTSAPADPNIPASATVKPSVSSLHQHTGDITTEHSDNSSQRRQQNRLQTQSKRAASRAKQQRKNRGFDSPATQSPTDPPSKSLVDDTTNEPTHPPAAGIHSLRDEPPAYQGLAIKDDEQHLQSEPSDPDSSNSCEGHQFSSSHASEVHNFSSSNSLLGIPPISFLDIDMVYVHSQRHVTAYAIEIFDYLKRLEVEYAPNPVYIQHIQNDINSQMREILICWLVEVADEFQLQPETLFLTKSYIDRFLSSHRVSRNDLQLVGITCMLIASKFEEQQPPLVDDFIQMTENSYTRAQMIQYEILVLTVLKFRLSGPNEQAFLKRYLMATALTMNDRNEFYLLMLLATYLTERTMQAIECVQFPPSLIAAASLCLALHTLGLDPWTSTLAHYTGYSESNLLFQKAVCKIHQIHLLAFRRTGDPNLETVTEKYNQKKYNQIASLQPADTVPRFVSPSLLSMEGRR